MKFKRKYLFIGLGVLAFLLLVIAVSTKPPIPVLTQAVTRGSFVVMLEAQGEVRIRERFMVSAPITGALDRVTLEEGDMVEAGSAITVVRPPALDPRQRQSLAEQVSAAESIVREGEARIEQVRSNLAQAVRQRERMQSLRAEGAATGEMLEQATLSEKTLRDELRAAEERVQSARHQRASAQANLAESSHGLGGTTVLRAPRSGRVLRVFEKSERTVMAGTPIVAIGDPSNVEILIDVLSVDAVRIHPGASVILEGWGGEKPLRAKVNYVEPSAYTKISALGVEEKRVNVIAELLDREPLLGDGYRVQARIELWRGENVVHVPASAVFRSGEQWAVFVKQGEHAKLKQVKVGQRSGFEVEITDGLVPSDVVILHPSNQVVDGVGVEAEQASSSVKSDR